MGSSDQDVRRVGEHEILEESEEDLRGRRSQDLVAEGEEGRPP